MEKKIKTTMAEMPRLWEEDYEQSRKHFTVGSGKAEYCMWTFGPCGLAYCYRVDKDGYACGRRAVEPSQTVFIHLV
jgi:hypothetical protein